MSKKNKLTDDDYVAEYPDDLDDYYDPPVDPKPWWIKYVVLLGIAVVCLGEFSFSFSMTSALHVFFNIVQAIFSHGA